MKNQSVSSNIDWITVAIYTVLVVIGWMNIYSADMTTNSEYYLDFNQNYGKQLIFICLNVVLIIVILTIDSKFYEKFSSVIFGASLVLLLGLFVFGKTIAGQRCWYAIGSMTLQPSEFAKAATALALAKYLSDSQVNLKNIKHQILALLIIALPILLILPQPDPGSALIFIMFILVLNREGLPSWYLWTGFIAAILFVMTLVIKPQYVILIAFIGIALHYLKSRRINRNIIASTIVLVLMSGFVFSVDYVFENVFKQHHRDRFNILLGKDVDMDGIGYNTNQSEIAIGSGGWIGKGFLEGTQTKGNFVPEQHTDYIFTTVGEEWGFVGSLVLVLLFVGLILRVLYLAENQKTKFSRVYGYGVAAVLFTHFFVNISMVVGIFPTIGVPLPFMSYGGSSLWGFTILLFIFIKMDANKVNEW
ncbi:rod shape determining protein RodA [Flavobacterium swingsii]|jgi:rod shape determining protein RodA|uniref:Cell wall polymerase n=1 Tax=Flavobacterium swingsii TaxID=498292 RepID=A0A1I0YBT6_9FLAO|nr:rod shape-determining protein RodA [Flavobacterium swingsii]SFB10855.1 rod shape determining protein RodA [Flavobacterium swingsii]